MRVSIAGITIDLPDGWFDVTDDLPDSTPASLAKPDGIGVIQFSVAKYAGGDQPAIDGESLRSLLVNFGESRGLGSPANICIGEGVNSFVGGDFGTRDELVRVWYVSNGQDVALVTYVTQQPTNPVTKDELRDAEVVIYSLEF